MRRQVFQTRQEAEWRRRTEGELSKGRQSKSTWPRKTTSNRDFIAGEGSGVETYLPNIGIQLINIQLS